MVISDEFKIIPGDINQKFDILIEGHNGLNKKFDQLDNKIDREIEDRRATDTVLLKEIREVRGDLNNGDDLIWNDNCTFFSTCRGEKELM